VDRDLDARRVRAAAVPRRVDPRLRAEQLRARRAHRLQVEQERTRQALIGHDRDALVWRELAGPDQPQSTPTDHA